MKSIYTYFTHLKLLSLMNSNASGLLMSLFALFVVNVSFTQNDYQVDWVSIDMVSDSWCVEEEEQRTISVTLTNSGNEVWNTNGQTTNLGVRWMDNGGGFAPWTDYFVRVNTGQLNPGETETFELTIEAKEAAPGPVYGNPLADGTYFLVFDVVNEGECWFGNNNGICGPGNTVFTSSPIELYNNCIYFCEDGIQDLDSPHQTDNVLWYDSNDNCVEPIHNGQVYSPFLNQTTLYYTNGFNDADVTVGSINGNPLSGNFAEVGQMFDIEAPADKDVIVTAITVVKRAASQHIDIYYRPESYANYWQGQDQAGWIKIVDEFSASGSTSSFAVNPQVEIPAGCRFGFYIHADVNYTTNTNVVTDGNIILHGGHGGVTSNTPFVMMLPRAFSGTIDYIARPYTEKVPFLAKKLDESIAPSAISDGGVQFCEGDMVDLVPQGGSLNEGAQWEWFSDVCGGTLLATGDTLSVVAQGADTYFVRASESGLCPATDCATIVIDDLDEGPSATGGGSATICVLDDYTVSDAVITNGNPVWTHDGEGTLTNETTDSPTYEPNQLDVGQVVTLLMTATSTTSCDGEASLQYELTIEGAPQALVEPGEGEATICADEEHTVTGVSAENGTIVWTHSGQGSLVNENTVSPTYIAHENDAGNTVELEMTVTSNNSCGTETTETQYLINVEPLPVVPVLSVNSPICEGEDVVVVITGEEDLTVTYSTDGGGTFTDIVIDASGTVEVLFENVEDEFEFEVTEIANSTCSLTINDLSVAIELNELPNAPSILAIEDICEGEDAFISISGDNNSEVYYTLDGGVTVLSITLDGDGEAVITLNGVTENQVIEIVSVENENCSLEVDDVSASLNVNSLPSQPSIVSNSPICIGETGVITINGQANETVTYVLGNDTLNLSLSSNGSFELEFDDLSTSVSLELILIENEWCSLTLNDLSTTIEANQLPTASLLSGGGEYCDYENPDNILVNVTGSSTWEVSYTLDGVANTATGTSTPISLGNESGTYVLTEVNDVACSNEATGSSTIVIKPSPNTPEINAEFDFCFGDELTGIDITSSVDTFEWYLDSELADFYQSGSSLSPIDEIGVNEYFVIAIEDGCESEVVTVTVGINPCELELPTAFTPNADGVNDVWELPHIDVLYPNNSVKVFNRWGELLFEHDSSSQGAYNNKPWDGSYNGNLLPIGSYIFIIEFNDTDNGVFNGAVSILYN